jgi:hypothetical protein
MKAQYVCMGGWDRHFAYVREYEKEISELSDYALAAHMGVLGPVNGLRAKPVAAAEEWNRRYPCPHLFKGWGKAAHDWANNN